MKIRHLLSVILFFAIIGLNAQVTEPENTLRTQTLDTIVGWKTGAVLSISATQSSFTNWAAGGQNSIAVNGISSLFANYKKRSSSWDNTLDLGYGIQRQGEVKSWIKTDDKIDFASKYGQKASNYWYYAALLNFKTQMDVGYKYPNDSVPISNFLAPAYIIGALGMDYKPNRHFSAFIAPVTAKITVVNDQVLADSGAFGVEKAVINATNGQIITPGETMRSEFGGYIKLAFQKDEILRNVNLTTKIDMFSNYLKNPQNIDISWEVLVAMKVNKYITVTLSTHLLYDDDIDIGIDTDDNGTPDKFGPRTQYKQVIGVGLSYKFAN
ncbi:MAG: DUF3078 domain-containing protein [Bacteroidales bacterium]|nr:DUF3078 domain-containing protein [Bacteroidales bacterium]